MARRKYGPALITLQMAQYLRAACAAEYVTTQDIANVTHCSVRSARKLLNAERDALVGELFEIGDLFGIKASELVTRAQQFAKIQGRCGPRSAPTSTYEDTEHGRFIVDDTDDFDGFEEAVDRMEACDD
jgi:hypothetical protein